MVGPSHYRDVFRPRVHGDVLEVNKDSGFPIVFIGEEDFNERFGPHNPNNLLSFGDAFRVYSSSQNVVIKIAEQNRVSDAGIEILAVSRLRRGTGKEGAVVVAKCSDCGLRGGLQIAVKRAPGEALNRKFRKEVAEAPILLLDFIRLGQKELGTIHQAGMSIGEVKLANFVGKSKSPELPEVTYRNLVSYQGTRKDGGEEGDGGSVIEKLMEDPNIGVRVKRYNLRQRSDSFSYEDRKRLAHAITEKIRSKLRQMYPSRLESLANVDFNQAVIIPSDEQLNAADKEVVILREGLSHLNTIVNVFKAMGRIDLTTGGQRTIEDLKDLTRNVFMFIESMEQMLNTRTLPSGVSSLSSQFRSVEKELRAIISHLKPEKDIDKIMQVFGDLIESIESRSGNRNGRFLRLRRVLLRNGDYRDGGFGRSELNSNERIVREMMTSVYTFLSNTFATYDRERGELTLLNDITAVETYFKNPDDVKQRVAEALGVNSLQDFYVYKDGDGVELSLLPTDPYLRQEYREFFINLFAQLYSYAQAVVKGKVGLEEEDPLGNWRIKNFFKTQLFKAQIRDWEEFLEIVSDELMPQNLPPKLSKKINSEVAKLRTRVEKMKGALSFKGKVSGDRRDFVLLSDVGIKLFERALAN